MRELQPNPLCYVSYEKDVPCAACYEGDEGYECTALIDTDNYMDDCPFYRPLCKYRHNLHYGFSRCEITTTSYKECENEDCPLFKQEEI